MEDRPDLHRLRPLIGEAAAGRVSVRVDRLSYGPDPLHDAVLLVRRLLQAGSPGGVSAVDLPIEQVCLGRRVGFDGRPVPEPYGPLTGLDTGGNGGTGFPSATLP